MNSPNSLDNGKRKLSILVIPPHAKAVNSITRGELYPPAEESLDADRPPVLEEEVPPVSDLRPYSMTPDAIFKKNRDDEAKGIRFYDERRFNLHHQRAPPHRLPAQLICLSGIDHVFLRTLKAVPQDNKKAKIGQRVLSTFRGRILYYVGPTTSTFTSRWLVERKFTSTMSSAVSGEEIAITFEGRQRGNRGYMTVHLGVNEELLGTCTQNLWDSTYVIKGADGAVLNKVQGPCYGVCAPCCFWCCNEHHEVLEPDGVTELGTVRCHWRKPVKKANGLLGVSFPGEMATINKALILGFLVLIHYQYFRRGGNGLFGLVLTIILVSAALILLAKFWFKLF